MKKLSSITSILLVTSFVLLFQISAFAQRGSLDSSFGLNGKVTAAITGLSLKASAVAIQADQKIVVSCYDANETSSSFIVMRFNPNGTKDSSFGSNGIVEISFDNNYYSKANALYVQRDNKILVGGTVNIGSSFCDFGIIRLKQNGGLDAGFGNNGVQTLSIGNGSAYDNLSALAIQRNGNIVATGFAPPNTGEYNNIILCRFKKNGLPDSTFGTNGKVFKSIFLNGDDYAYALAIQADDKIFVTGYGDSSYHISGAYPPTKVAITVLKYTKDGVPDTSFGRNGVVVTNADTYNPDSTSTSQAFAITLQKDGKIIVAGNAWLAHEGNRRVALTEFCVIRYLPNGNVDSSFGTNGIARSTKKSRLVNVATALAVMPDKKIIASGRGGLDLFHTDFKLMNYKKNGSPDASFGIGGLATTDFGSDQDGSSGMVVQADNNIVLAGYTFDSTTKLYKVALARYKYNESAAFIASTEMNETITIPSIKLYPNPVKDILHITGLAENTKLIIRDNNGKAIKHVTVTGAMYNYNVAALPAGVYYIICNGNKNPFTLKFVKQ